MTSMTKVGESNPAYVQMLADLFSETVLKTMTLRLIEETSEVELTHSQYVALRYLFSHGRCTVGHIAEGLSISYPASTKLITRLAEKELVTRTESSADRRQAEVDLTDQGREIITNLRQTRQERFNSVLHRLSPADRAALERGLERFIVVAVQDEGVNRDICLRCGTDRLDECPVNTAHQEILGPSLNSVHPVHLKWE
ncbi:MAG: MarR family transcriptional regulator [Armatimonadetes bacterium]|nr:MarR family transcriptional regulator [Armatimonadota bacterium]